MTDNQAVEPVAGLEQNLIISGNLGLQPESFRLKKLQQFALLFPHTKGLQSGFQPLSQFSLTIFQYSVSRWSFRVGARFGARSIVRMAT